MDFNFTQIYLIDDVDIDEVNMNIIKSSFKLNNTLKDKNKNRYKYYLITSDDLIHTRPKPNGVIRKYKEDEDLITFKIKPIYDKYIFKYYDNLIPAEENIKIPKFENVRIISYKDNNMRFKKYDNIIIKFIESLLKFNDSELYIPYYDKWIKNINEVENKELLKPEFILKCKYNFEELHDYFKNYYNKIYVCTDYKQYCIENDWI